jgi:hypothetical protein
VLADLSLLVWPETAYHSEAAMPNAPIEYRFKIEAYSPETIPMARLAEYMMDMAILLGNRDRVHFKGLEPGSTTLVQLVEYEAAPKVRTRVNGVRNRTAPEDAINAYRRINRKMREDNADGFVEATEESGTLARVIEFPGRKKTETEKLDPIFQPGSLDGLLIRVGGKDETVPVYVEEDEIIHRCTSNRGIAKSLAPLLFEVIRVYGTGKWNYDDFGNWVMEDFRISTFERLETTSLRESVARLRAIESNIHKIEDPIEELNKLRG